jgi:DNA-binding NtrC family response regulator
MANNATPAQKRVPILVVDDDADIRLALEMTLKYQGFVVWTAKDGTEALKRLETEEKNGLRAALVLTDLKMPKLDGMGLLDAILERPNPPPVVMISGHGDVATAVDAVKRGASNFLEKPLDENRVLVTIKSALREDRLSTENRKLRKRLNERYELVGTSAAMKRLAAQIETVAASDAAVLITGENGTGKEVVARNLHAMSDRADGPFVTVNCAAIPDELIESELFGHEKGSFTGAFERRVGHFEAANGGTLFLDEIAELPLPLQAKLLRALQDGEVRRIGETRAFAVDVRIITATHRDLLDHVRRGAFREDLYYRLKVLTLTVPPLRERREDVVPLARQFLAELAPALLGFTPAAEQTLERHAWPGNVRELRNAVQHGAALARGPQVDVADLPEDLLAVPGTAAHALRSLAEVEREHVLRVVDACNGSQAEAARILGIGRNTLWRKLRSYASA